MPNVDKYPVVIEGNHMKIDVGLDKPHNYSQITIITPTRNRAHFSTFSKANIQRQSYPQKLITWLILDDSPKNTEELWRIPNFQGQFKYVHLPCETPMSIGEKRNVLCDLADTDIIVCIDDDDYIVQHSVATRVRILMDDKQGKQCVGCSRVQVYDIIRSNTFEAYDPHGYFAEGSLCLYKTFWEKHMFNHTSSQEGLPLYEDENKLLELPHQPVLVCLTHGGRTIS